jgi:hypothetical protein
MQNGDLEEYDEATNVATGRVFEWVTSIPDPSIPDDSVYSVAYDPKEDLRSRKIRLKVDPGSH